jgi:hypothetical protein
MNKYGKNFIPENINNVGSAYLFYINENFNNKVFEVEKLDSITNIVKLRACILTPKDGIDTSTASTLTGKILAYDSKPEIV